jgi:hypothetical protein
MTISLTDPFPNAVDSPAFELDVLGTNKYASAYVGDQFNMWMLFRPNGIEGTTHAVPIRVVGWFWQGKATNNGNGFWSLISGTNGVTSSDSNTENYPMWNCEAQRYVWMPPL